MIGNIFFAEMNDIDSVKNLINDKTCAILMETLQGEGGIHPADAEFIKEIRQSAMRKTFFLSLMRFSAVWAVQDIFLLDKYGVKPDIMTSAKALPVGVPMGAFVLNEKGGKTHSYQEIMEQPMAVILVGRYSFQIQVFDLYDDLNIGDNAKEMGDYLFEKLKDS